MMTPREFLEKTHATRWHECHWSLAGTIEQARAWFADHGITGAIYQVPFGWWCVEAVG